MASVTIFGRDARGVWVVLGLLALAGVVGLVAVVSLRQGWADAAKVTGVVSFFLAAASATVQLLGWSRRGTSSVLTEEQLTQARALLAARVNEQWKRESAARALGDPEPMPVRWKLTDHTVMDHPHLALTGTDLAGTSTDIGALAAQFTQLPRRRLVVLGPAGAGKTTLAVQMLLQLLATRTPEEPVPVLLSLAGWNTTSAPRVQDWLTDRVAQDYPAVRAVHPGAPRTGRARIRAARPGRSGRAGRGLPAHGDHRAQLLAG